MEGRAALIRKNLQTVQNKIRNISDGMTPRLVVVSKTWPVSDILSLYDAGQRNFGENYLQELVEKAFQLPDDIRWHFIGALQSNKLKMLTSIPNLDTIETIDDTKKAVKLEKLVHELGRTLNILIQVNTSGEEQKHGVSPQDAITLALHLKSNCPSLKLKGLMTIGSSKSSEQGSSQNSDFSCLVECRQMVATALVIPPESLELSMGMSQDYEQAVRRTNRVFNLIIV